MATRDLVRLATSALRGHKLRTSLSMLGIAIGICAVILLTSIGEGTRLYVLDQFTQFGTNIIGINPGKQETVGIPGVLGGTTKKLTVDDAEAIARLHQRSNHSIPLPKESHEFPLSQRQHDGSGGYRIDKCFVH